MSNQELQKFVANIFAGKFGEIRANILCTIKKFPDSTPML